MGFIAKDSGGGNFTPPPTGTHLAVCTQIINIGHQYSEYYGKAAHKLLLGWELFTDEKQEDGSPFVAFKRYTLSLGDKAHLRRDLESWRGKAFTEEELEGFDVEKILGHACMVSITHRKDGKKTYADVAAVMALPKGTDKPTPITKIRKFDVDNPDMEVMGEFSDGLQKTIKNSAEWQAREGGGDGSAESAGVSEDEVNQALEESDCPF